jgi:hypothetical protein
VIVGGIGDDKIAAISAGGKIDITQHRSINRRCAATSVRVALRRA